MPSAYHARGGREQASHEHGGGDAGCTRDGRRRRAGPGSKCSGIDASTYFGAEARQILAQIELRSKLRHGRLPRARLVESGRREQPGGERLLAHPRARRREQLEERALPEEVEVCGIEMRRIEEALARLSAAGPAILEAREAALVEGRRSLGSSALPDDVVVEQDQRDECDEGKQQPRRREAAGTVDEPENPDARGKDRKPKIRERSLAAEQGGCHAAA